MIFYNIRYRGPYEYEKFLLNTLQYSNIINNFIVDVNEVEPWKTLKETCAEIDNAFIKAIGDNQMSEQIYKKFIMLNVRGDDK